ncbi:hypothetical protein SAMN05421678_10857 [Actinopolymorpha cephalotaxi]|uniref:Uncharacterized protein n=1 Tax=Actinopolymorpha cephalotaxi TaxID=504797 RepID=A0A1I2U7U5_9ACTN|nr:hypothetical protein [Actinopolymorpha cephalotaxi]NYH86476.1 hypothetical protein [Actinopolymorpha cephalotaxi]SFG73148.1 hypothetical protein SAMN05421678_10857 [Actinopolymorpha cephalotaxi]
MTTGSGAGSSAPDRPDRSGADTPDVPDVEFAGSEFPDAESVGARGANHSGADCGLDYSGLDYDGNDHGGNDHGADDYAGMPLPGGAEFADADTTTSNSPASPAVDGADRPADLRLEPATAFGVEGYDPADPWNAVLCVENETVATVLPLTPRSLDHLLAGLIAVREAQRAALGAEPAPVLDDETGATSDELRGERPGALRQVGNAARLATGSASVARMWNDAGRGRMVIIGGAVLFVLIGFLASLFTR